MKTHISLLATLFLLTIILAAINVEAKPCKPSGTIHGRDAPRGQCDPSGSDCCERGKKYKTFKCSPRVSRRTKAVLTINSFENGGDGGGPSECDGKYHSNHIPIVALSTGWFREMAMCFHNITIHGNGRKVRAMVVDECDSTVGCDEEHGFQPPCPNNIVDASEAVWKALRVKKSDWGELDVHWSH